MRRNAAQQAAVTVQIRPPITHIPGVTSLVLDSPHSETAYPADSRHVYDMAMLRSAEDTHVEKLYDFAPVLGGALDRCAFSAQLSLIWLA